MSNIIKSLDVRCFNVIGLWQFIISSRNEQEIYNAIYFVTVNVLLMGLFLPFVITQLIGSFGFYNDFVTLIEKLAVTITLVESILKFLYCCTQRSHLGILSQVFDVNFLKSMEQNRFKSERILIDSATTLTRNINIFIMIIFTTVGIWNSLPIFYCITKDKCDDLKIMPTWYPFSVNQTPTKQIIYILEFTIMCYCASLLYNINCLLLSYAKILASQIQVLQENLISIENNSQKMIVNEIKTRKADLDISFLINILDRNMEDLLICCICDHQKIIRFAAKMENIFNPLFLFQVIVSTLTLCLVGVSLTAQSINSASSTMSMAMTCKFVMYMVFGLMELLVYSWCGHIVLDQTKKLHESFYYTAWTSGSLKFQKNILMAMTKTKFPSRLSAGKFFDVDLVTFTTVMKASFSYFTFLYGINSNK